MLRLGAVVVNYNAADQLAGCVESVAAGGAERIVVVDNGSSDASEAVARGTPATWVQTGANVGYGRAANQGAAVVLAGGADAVLVCNPDLVLHPGALHALGAALAADPGVGLVAPQLLNGDGSIYPSGRPFPDLVDALGHGLLGLVAPRNRFTRRYRRLDWDHREATDVDWVSGACVLVRRAAWEQVGGFDPAFFMYMEDVDLCWRLGRAGWRVRYEPAAVATHFQGVSARLHPYRMLAAHHASMWRFARRTTPRRERVLLPVIALGLLARLGVACVEHRVGPVRAARASRIP